MGLAKAGLNSGAVLFWSGVDSGILLYIRTIVLDNAYFATNHVMYRYLCNKPYSILICLQQTIYRIDILQQTI